jgi:hypothetical protein
VANSPVLNAICMWCGGAATGTPDDIAPAPEVHNKKGDQKAAGEESVICLHPPFLQNSFTNDASKK